MLSFILAFLAGDVFLQFFSHLPSKNIICLLLVSGFLFHFLSRKYVRYSYLLLAFILGFAFSAWYAHSILSWELSKNLEGKTIQVSGYIASLPIKNNWYTHFLFYLPKEHVLIKLSSTEQNKPFYVGQEWQFHTRLKRIHGTQNPGGFDYEAWALQKGLRATGYIVKSKENKLLSHHWYHYPVDQLRQLLQEKITRNSPQSRTSVWLSALIIGERNHISQKDWEVLRATGTNHLMAIAGLHIGILAGFIHFIVSFIWRNAGTLSLYFPASKAAALAALIMSIFYSALSGFSIPTQRACFMLIIFIVILLSKKQMSIWHTWAGALFFVVFINPLSVLSESFWLSFGTIALIIYGMQARLYPQGFWWQWGRVQWVIGIGLIPITLFFYHQASLISFIANSVAIPWLGFLILPFCFLSSIFLFIYEPIGKLCLFFADISLAYLWQILTWFAHLDMAVWQQVIPNHFILFTTIIGFILLLLPSGLPGRWLGIIWILPLVCFQPLKPTTGEIWLTLLDVGQGLSAIIQTNNHLLIFDTGAKYNDNMDMGESIIIPYLQTLHTKKIDMLVISHGDNDHIGGANSILQYYKVKDIKTSVPEKLPLANYCLRGDQWQWDGVQFGFLYPDNPQLNLGNDSSCVLKIDNGVNSILLTGDIEKFAENQLLKNPNELSATILIAPHHGSKTSGVSQFISAVHPQVVLYATGYRNRYHFPHPIIVKSYTDIHAQQLNTAETGAIFLKINKEVIFNAYRQQNHHFWYNL